MNFLQYVLQEIKSRRLSHSQALELVHQYHEGGSGAKPLHPLLQWNTSTLAEQRFSTIFVGDESFLADHIVQGTKVLPGAAHLEMAREAVARATDLPADEYRITLKNIVFAQPVVVGDEPRQVQIGLTAEADGAIAYEIYTEDGDEIVIHSQGRASIEATEPAPTADLPLILAEQRELEPAACYAAFARMGLAYGPAHQVLQRVRSGRDEHGRDTVMAEIALPAFLHAEQQDYLLHPSLLDGALQAGIGLAPESEPSDVSRFLLPFAVDRVQIYAALPLHAKVIVRHSVDSKHGSAVQKLDITIVGEDNRVAAQLEGFSSREAVALNVGAQTLLLAPIWRGQETASLAPGWQQHWVVLCGMPDPALVNAVRAVLPETVCVQFKSTETELAGRFGDHAAQLLAQLQTLLSTQPAGRLRLQLVVPSDGDNALLQGLAGMLKSVQQEHPRLEAQLLMLDVARPVAELAAQIGQQAGMAAREVRWRDDEWQQTVFEEVSAAMPADGLWNSGGVYLITGGLGGLGRLFAKEIAERAPGATLMLTGRRELDDAGWQQVRELEALGATVQYRVVDVSDRDAVRQLVLQIQEEHEGLNGIVHSAGVLRDSLLMNKTAEELAAVLAPKVAGLINLDEASREIELDCFICFSSTAAVFGNVGQADYAAANGFMDAYARYRSGLVEQGLRHGRTVSVNWPLWADGGMQIDAAGRQRLEQLAGLSVLGTEAGIGALYHVLGTALSQALVLEGSAGRIRRWLASLTAPAAPVAEASMKEGTADQALLKDKALSYFKRQLAETFKLPIQRIEADTPLEHYGIDSVLVTQLTSELEKTFGVLSKTLLFEYQTLNALVGYFLAEHRARLIELFKLGGDDATKARGKSARAAISLPAEMPRRRRERFALSSTTSARPDADAHAKRDIAIIGLAGRYPQARDLKVFWENLRAGKDCITEIPKERWDHSRYFDPDKTKWGTTYSKWGGFIDGVDEFDPQFFNISPREAEFRDPQERLFLQCTHAALEDAGYTRETLGQYAGDREIGVYVGVMYEEYPLYGAQAQARGDNVALGGGLASIANRVSYYFNLHGPSLGMDSMCSSSLTALHLACESLRRGQCSMAIAGGVNLSIHPNKYLALAQGKFASSKGRCESFGMGGDGYVPSEGVGAVILKPLDQAIADGDHIYGVIKATALNHGGKTNGYTVPNPVAQAAVIGRALKESGIDARTISYLEAHGTGTSLGDPIEITGLSKAFGASAQDHQYCAIGSVKSNIGHSEGAAGIAGLTKVLLQMQHGQLVPSLHSRELNPHIDFAQTPFVVQQELAEWHRPVVEIDGVRREYPRRAGLSSFGAGGSNAHVIVEEYVAPLAERNDERAGPVAVVLSARDEERLREYAQQLLGALSDEGWSDEQLEDVAYTLQVGREAMDERLALLADTTEEVKAKLAGYLKGRDDIEGLYRGQTKQSRQLLSAFSTDEDLAGTLETWLVKGKLDKLLELWVQGLSIDWNQLYGGKRMPRRISLPTYPFARERYWVPEVLQTEKSETGLSRLHPLLHRNTSDLSEQRFSTRFSGEEFFLSDHVVQGKKVLPGVAYLEMAREALVQGAGVAAGAGVRLKDVVWLRPFVVDGQAQELHVGLYPESDGSVGFEIYSGEDDVHSQGRAESFAAEAVRKLDLEVLRAQCARTTVSGSECYKRFAALGLVYGPAHRAIEQLYVGEAQALARLVLPGSVAGTREQYVLHPSVLDATLQSVAGLVGEEGQGQLALPFAVQEIEVIGGCVQRMWALARPSAGSQAGDRVQKFDIDLCDDEGVVAVRIKGFATRVLEHGLAVVADKAVEVLLWQAQWQDAPAPYLGGKSSIHGERLVLLFDGKVDAERLSARLGARCERLPEDYAAQAGMLLSRLQALIRSKPVGPVLVQVVVPDEGLHQVSAGLAGLLKTARQEQPKLFGQLIAVGEGENVDSLAAKLTETAACPQDIEIRYSGGVRQILAWSELKGTQPVQPWNSGGVYLITGGLGGLGRLFAKEIAERAPGATLMLTGRRELDDAGWQQVRELEALGATVQYRVVDVSDRDAVRQLVLQIQEEHEGLNGIVHSAGVLRDSLLMNKTAEELAAVLAPKVAGLINLDEASREIELDCFICFSSTAAVFGNVGQADYAAANGFMDAYARYRSGLVEQGLRHGRTVSVNWPLWADGGMQIDAAGRQRLEQLAGLSVLGTEAGIGALYHVLGTALSQALVLEGSAGRIRRWLASLTAPAAPVAEASMKEGTADQALLKDKALSYFKRQLAETFKLPIQRIEADTPLEHYGIDSVLVTQLTSELEKTFGVLSKTLLFEYQTLNALVGYFLAEHRARLIELFKLGGDDATKARGKSARAAISLPAEMPRRRRERFALSSTTSARPDADAHAKRDIAIIGLAGRYPQARDLKVFWENLRAGKDCITEIPKERWDHSRYFDPDKTKWGTTYSKWGGFIDGVDEFDPQFFNISPREAEFRDPQERLFLQCTHAALEDAGYTRETLGQYAGDREIGVYVGVMYEEYPLYGAQAQARGDNVALGGGLASIANRVSYYFNLHGPSLGMDSMCSSSLTALHLACESLRRGQCSMAIAGGVNLSIHPNKYLALAQGKFASSKGRCESFGMGGDGYVPSEGVGAVILKPLDQAIADGDHIYGVIKATALNHGGKTNGYTVPNPVAQAAVIGRALKESGIDARTISYLEAHGTGTSLGDPIEITGLSKAFGASAQDHQYCAIGSVKSNIGHSEGAAGIAGLTKVLLQMQHGQLVPSLHSRELNPHIDFAQTPFVVQQELAEWHRPVVEIDGVRREYPRRAGLSSFGAGGSNAHVIVEEYVAPLAERNDERAGPVAVVLSARDEERLREYAQQLLGALSDEGWSDEQLEDVAYTLQVGREAMDERLALLADTTEEVKAKLAGYLEGRDDIEGLYRGQTKQSRQLLSAFSTDEDLAGTLETWLVKGKLDKLLELWVQGLSIDWNQLYGGKRMPRRISLPTYPFARERYWVPQFEGQTPVHALASVAGVGALHPLVQRNTSDFMEQRYSSRFDGGEFFLSDHMVQGQKVLPGVAYLEMARAALQLTLGEMLGGVRLRNVTWSRPLIVGVEAVEVHIGLSPQEDGSVAYEVYRDAGEDEAISLSRGLIEAIESPAARMDVAALRAQCNRGEWAGSECYERFSALGLSYGPAHRAIERLYVGEGQVLARLALPESVASTRERYVLHPSVLDAALQSLVGLAGKERQGRLALPFAVQEIEIVGGCAERMWALARPSVGSQAGDRVQKFDIDLCDDEGVIAVRIRSFATRPADTDRLADPVIDDGADRLMLLAPVWDVVQPAALGEASAKHRLLIIGGTPLQQQTLGRQYGQAQIADFAGGNDIAEIADALRAHDEFDHLVWIAPSSASLSVSDERLIAAQQEGVLSCFRLIKALLAGGYGGKALEWSVITEQTQAVHRAEANHPAHAGVHGLVGALAKEYPNWKIRLIDAPQGEVWPLEQALALAPDAQGDGWAWRDGQWYRQKLLPAEVAANEVEPYRQGGVYVVIGGAGGIGEAWSEHVIRHHGAQVIWIGRRALDAELQGKIDRLGRVGPAPHYIAADATERASLQRAYDEIKQRFGPIHGVIHSAIVLGDQSLANMDEARFAASLSAKVDVSVRLAQVFAGEALDFVLFFSSLQSFSKAAGQSNYAAGCTFKDAFARSLGQAWPCPVRVMNWGWWGSVGIVASPAYQERMAQLGLASIAPDEGMTALATLLGGRVEQLALLKTTAQAVLSGPSAGEVVHAFAPDYPSLIGAIGNTAVELEELETLEVFDAVLQPLLCKLLCGQLQTLGLRAGQQGTVAEIAALLGLRGMYGRWLEQTLRILAEQGYVRFDGQQLSTEGMPTVDVDTAWAEWDRCKADWLQTPALHAQITLVETTLRALPGILYGRIPATDVMFPNASMRLVEDIYKHNPVADYFNTVLSDAVVSFIQARLQQDPQAQIRILEIGAGTGGTSAVLFERLRPYAAHVAEYNYTDLSKAFLFHAEQEYGAANPYLRYQLLDIGRPLAEQGVSLGHYDLVVATNVLHATANIRRTVRNAKAALRTHGLLMLNELSRNHPFAHLTFGLLEGWWLYEDPELRIAGCPALSAESWHTVLEDEGLGAAIYPAGDKASLGQQIIVAESDGVARQQRPAVSIRQVAKASAPSPVAVRAVTPVAETVDASASMRDKAVAYFKALLGKTLKLSSHQIDSAQPLETYGIDSILVVSMTTSLQEVFEDVSSTLFFEYRSIDELVTHFLKTQPEALAKVLNLAPAGSAPSRAVAAPAQAERIVVPIRAGRRFADRGASKSEAPPRANDIAIIGLAGRYPQAWDIDAFWDNLKQGRHCISEIPAERWDHRAYFDAEKGKAGKSYSKWGGFIDGVDEFDPLFFNIAPREAEMMDPQERLFLAQIYAGIEDAGYMPGSLSVGGKVGVFAGVMNGYYGSSRYWSIANRVSYLFNFQGPSLAVDTACSSSLTALHLALESLHSGACDIAIAGGVNVIIDPAHYVGLSAMNMLSAGDRCRAFGADADGFVDGEGVGAVILKPLDQAITDGDHIYGVIKATALNHGGKTNGYTVPNPVAQAEVIARTLQKAGIDARTISYIETHGTGTSLGDPIEIAGLSKAFGETTQDRQYCAIGSVKSNIGHTESAAGIAGLTKVLLQMKRGQLAPSLHAEQLNPQIDFARTPFVVQRELGQWLRPEVEIDGVRRQYPRRAGISSFGAGGANAHVIVEEYVAADGPAFHAVTAADPALLVLSARDEERLRARVRQLLEAIERGVVTQENLADAAYTLQVGREAMNERLALSAGSLDELKAKLAGYLEGRDGIEELYHGQVKRNKEAMALFATDEELQEAVAKWVERKKFAKVLELWVKGLTFDWSTLYAERKPKRISLPTYPFARERYWTSRSLLQPAVTTNAGAGETPAEHLTLLVPTWQVESPASKQNSPASGNMLVIGGTPLQQEMLQRHYGQVQLADFAAGHSIAEIADALAAHDEFDHLVWIAPSSASLSVGDERLIAAQQEGVLSCFRLIKALLAGGYGGKALEWSVITEQTQAVHRAEANHPVHAGVHGLVGALAKEYPNWKIRLIDAPQGEVWPLEQALALAPDAQGDGWAWRDGQWYRQKLLPAEVAANEVEPYRQGGVYVVIGGAGGIGEAWSEHVIRHHGAQVIWIGRRALDAELQGKIDRLGRVGPAPHYIAADATERASLQRAYDEIKQRFGPIHGVIHSAIVLGDQSLANMDEARFAASLSAKVDVSVRLAQVFAGEALDFVLFFSSLQSFSKAAGQSNYAAGCTFKDAFARSLGQAWPCPVRVMNWGWWGSVGIAATSAYQSRMAQLGLASIEPAEGMAALAQLLGGQHNQLAVLKTTVSLPAQAMSATTRGIVSAQTPALWADVALDDEQLRILGVAAFKTLIGGLLHVPEQQIDASESLATYGVDSISVSQMSGLLAGVFAGVSQSLFYDYQTIDDLVAYFLATQRDALAAWATSNAAVTPQSATLVETQVSPEALPPVLLQGMPVAPAQVVRPQDMPKSAGSADIAIIGMACRFPGADTVEAYWQMLLDGDKADNHGPASRWPERINAAGGASPQLWGAFLDDVDGFDPGFFGISLLQAEMIDPQERLFLMNCWHALEDAGYGNDKWLAERSRAGKEVGVFAGVTAASYNLVGFEQSLKGRPQATSQSFASVANRVSHALSLAGPSLSVDTMCSSSLVALHMACESLRSEECSMAIAGGVNLNLHPSRLEGMAQIKLICEDGESRSFGAGGKGFLAGEGVAALVLKPLDAALRDGDTVHAVIKGSAVGHSGTTLSYFAPSTRGQTKVIERALRNAGMTADEVSYIEMQCAGDEATDAAEFEAIKLAYGVARRPGEPLRLGSVKPNIGHAEAAASMAQLIKVVLQLKHRTQVETLLGNAPNPQMSFADANLVIQQKQRHWATEPGDAHPLRAAINAFGAGGTAAHVIVESYEPPVRDRNEDGPQLLVLSAKSRQALRRSAEALVHRLGQVAQAAEPVRLTDIAYTLQVGRRELNHRLAFATGSVGDALERLHGWLSDSGDVHVQISPPDGITPAPSDLTGVQARAASGDLPGLARLWTGGMPIDWRRCFAGRGHCRYVSLPGYAFDLRSCWPEGTGIRAVGAEMAMALPSVAELDAGSAAAVVAEAEAESAAGLLQSVKTLAGMATHMDKQIKTVIENLYLMTVSTLYTVLSEKGVIFDERSSTDGALGLYPQVGSAGDAVDFLLERLTATPFMVADATGARLALPADIRNRKQLEQMRSQCELLLRVLPEYRSYYELLGVVLGWTLDGSQPSSEQFAVASALLVDVFTEPSKLAFLNRLTAELCLAKRLAGQETVSVLMIGAGGFEFLSAIVAVAPRSARIECRVISGWPQIAQGVVELGRERFPDVTFVSLVPLVAGSLTERLVGSVFDAVIVHTQDPCAQEAAELLERRVEAGTPDSLVFVTEPIERYGLQLILELSGMWSAVAGAFGIPRGKTLVDALVQAGYRQQKIVAPVLSVFSRELSAVQEADAVTGSLADKLAEIQQFLLKIFADALGDGSKIGVSQDFADAGLNSLAWALIYTKLQQRFGKAVDVEILAANGEALSVDVLAGRLFARLHGGALSESTVSPTPLADRVMRRLAAISQTKAPLEYAAHLARRGFTSSRGQFYEYFECGSGPTLIFLTALAFTKSIWENQIREFSTNYRLIFPHLPGHAGSVFSGVGFAFEDLADDLIELMDELGIAEAHVIGWCIAGNVAQLMALRHSRRLKSLTLVCTTPTDARMRGINQRNLEDYSVSPLLNYQMEFSNIYREEFLAPEVSRSLSIIQQSHVPVEPQALMSFISSLFDFDTRDRLGAITMPTLIIAGRWDIAFPLDQVSLLKDGIAHARFIAIEKAGHLPFLNQSAVFNEALLSFLAEIDSSPRRRVAALPTV